MSTPIAPLWALIIVWIHLKLSLHKFLNLLYSQVEISKGRYLVREWTLHTWSEQSLLSAPWSHHGLAGLSDLRWELRKPTQAKDNDFCAMNKWQQALSSTSTQGDVNPVTALVLEHSLGYNECWSLVMMLSSDSKGGGGGVKKHLGLCPPLPARFHSYWRIIRPQRWANY